MFSKYIETKKNNMLLEIKKIKCSLKKVHNRLQEHLKIYDSICTIIPKIIKKLHDIDNWIWNRSTIYGLTVNWWKGFFYFFYLECLRYSKPIRKYARWAWPKIKWAIDSSIKEYISKKQTEQELHFLTKYEKLTVFKKLIFYIYNNKKSMVQTYISFFVLWSIYFVIKSNTIDLYINTNNKLIAYSLIILIYLIMIILTIAFFTLLERKVMSSIQRRRGPNIVGLFGFAQPFADGLKLLIKEILYTSNSNIAIFIITPIFTFMCTLIIFLIIPLIPYYTLLDLPFSILFLLAISSLSIYGIIFSGWASNSKYAFLGGIRSASQMISYEITISTIYLCIVMISGSFALADIIDSQEHIWNICPLLPIWILFVITSLAETNRAPFDLPEAEAELVAGYNVEYSAITFALFFLAEYGNMILMSMLSTIFFFGGWSWLWIISTEEKVLIFSLKVVCNMFIFLWIRAAFPRYRYDQLMKIGWKVLIPLSFTFIMLESALIVSLHI